MARALLSDNGMVRIYVITDDATGEVVGYESSRTPTVAGDNADLLRARARLALAVNADYLALPAPTAADAITQVGRLTRECSGLIRLLLGLFDSTDGT